MVEALRDQNIESVALNAAYHPSWWQGTVGFLQEAGINVVWAGTHDQGWFATQEEINDLSGVSMVTWQQKAFSTSLSRHPMSMPT